MATSRTVILIDGSTAYVASDNSFIDFSGAVINANITAGGGGTPLPEETGIADGMFTVLGSLGFVGTIQDRLLAFYQANGATSNDLQDAEQQFLVARGIARANVQDMWSAYFTSRGYSPSYHEGMKDFWVRNGGAL
jgi:hypothetical protein